jgi:septum formation protein
MGTTINPLSNLDRYEILLASHSPRRRELLGMLGLNFKVAASIEIDESYPDTLPADEVPSFLSRKKAKAYRATLSDNQLIITADTVVVVGNTILGKPHSDTEARSMLHSLSDRKHRVITGVTVMTKELTTTFSALTEVEFAALSDDEIQFYVENYKPLDKAGAYGIQEWIGAIGVKAISGSYYNVMGLPVHRLYCELLKF